MLCGNLHKEGAIGAPGGHYSDAEIADTKVKAEALAADVEAEGTVLVQNNDNTLPLAADNKKINVFGWASTAWLGGGSGSGGVSGVNTDLLAALTAYGVAYNTELTDMYKDFQDGREYTRTLSAWPEQSGRLYEPDINNQTYYTQSMLDNAKSFSDTAVVVIGRLAGESNDATKQQYKRTEKGGDIVVDDTRTMLELTTEEENLLNYVGTNYAHVVVLINSTNVMELGQIETIPGIDACLIAGLSGSEGATAVPEVLWGDREPSGRTADTWAYDLTTAASYANAGMEGVGKYSAADGLYPADGTTNGNLDTPYTYEQVSYVDYAEGIYIGYKWYETADAEGYWDAESNEHGTGYDAVEVNGTSAPNPYAGKALPHYTSGKVQRVPDAEWETLLGRHIPADTVKIDRNMTLGELNHSRSPLCWLVWAVLTMLLNASYKRGKPNLNVMFQYNMPLRALAKMTSGAISMGMVDGIVLEAKGFWVIGLLKVIVEAVKNIILNAQLESQHQEYLQSKENIESLGRLAHDLKHQIAALRAEVDPEHAAAGFEQLEKSVQRYSAQQHTGNPVLDVILTTKERTCADRGISFTAVADGSLLSNMSSMDIASLFGNAIDNAIEATSKLADPEQRLIKLALFEQNSFTVVRIENYYDSRLKKDAEGNLRTTKRDDQHRHGFGVKSIRHIAQQYGGEVTIRTDDHWFVLTVLLPRQTGLMAM